jgi:cytochrome P450
MAELVSERRSRPQDDLASVLATATVNGEPLPDAHVLAMCGLVAAGGVDTTTALTANALHWLHANPGHRRRLIEDPGLIPVAVEEFLRYFSPVQMMARTATRDVELGGQPIRAGDRLLLSFAAANRDPSIFTDPADLILDRTPNRYISFGNGVHRCVGSHLARVQATVMLEEILKRMPDYAIDDAQAVRYPTIGAINGYIDLPATFTPSAPVGMPFPD